VVRRQRPEKSRPTGDMVAEVLQLLNDTADKCMLANERAVLRTVRQLRREESGFRRRLRRRWGKALDGFGGVLAHCHDLGDSLNSEVRANWADGSKEYDPSFDVLTRLHAKACRTGSEVLVLMEAGHATGAHTRWRTLHELAVVAFVLRQHGADLARRYLDHEVIESGRILQDYTMYGGRLGLEAIEEGQAQRLASRRQEVLHKHGDTFKEQYGWASEVLGKGKPNFSDLERHVGMDHWRPYYRLASHGVHAQPKGALWSLEVGGDRSILPSGRSNAGLEEPGQSGLISLLQVTHALATYKPTVERLFRLRTIARLSDRAVVEFLEAAKVLEADERRLKNAGLRMFDRRDTRERSGRTR
jgi:hypothetical protein